MPFSNPTATTKCTHTFCKECITEALLFNEECPVDRTPLTLSGLIPASTIVRNVSPFGNTSFETDTDALCYGSSLTNWPSNVQMPIGAALTSVSDNFFPAIYRTTAPISRQSAARLDVTSSCLSEMSNRMPRIVLIEWLSAMLAPHRSNRRTSRSAFVSSDIAHSLLIDSSLGPRWRLSSGRVDLQTLRQHVSPKHQHLPSFDMPPLSYNM